MSDLSKAEIAYLHLKYKLENAQDIESMQSVGLMRVEDVSKKVLKDIYAVEDVGSAVSECAKQGLIDVNYVVVCDKCSAENLIFEEEYVSSRTLRELISDGPPCRECGHKLHLEPKSVDLRLAVPQKLLGKEEDTINYNVFSRFFRWFIPKKKQN